MYRYYSALQVGQMHRKTNVLKLPQEQGNLRADHPPQRGTTDLGADQGGIGQGSDLGVDPPERGTADLGAGQGGVGQGDLGVDQPGNLGRRSISRSGEDETPRSRRPLLWAERMDMDPAQEEARLRDPVFIDSDEEQEDLVEVSEKTSKFLHLKCTLSGTNVTRKKDTPCPRCQP